MDLKHYFVYGVITSIFFFKFVILFGEEEFQKRLKPTPEFIGFGFVVIALWPLFLALMIFETLSGLFKNE